MATNSFVKELYRVGENLISLAKEMDDIVNESIKETFDEVERDLDIEFYHCVDKFYREYTPKYYDRTYALYEGYKFNRGNDGLSLGWETNGSLIPNSHRASPEYIFHLAYELGQHGGSASNGLWRRPIWVSELNQLIFWEWGDPAAKRVPIDVRINQSVQKYKSSKKMQSYFDSFFYMNLNKRIQKYGLGKWF